MSLVLRGIGTVTPEHSIEQEGAAEFGKCFVYAGDATEDIERLLNRVYRLTQVKRRSSVVLEHANGGDRRPSFYHEAASADDHGPTTRDRMRRYSEAASPLALEASELALRNASVSSDEITHLITVSCTGFQSPGVEFSLINTLPLSPAVSRLNVGFMGCHGAFNGLNAAQAFVGANPRARVLLSSVELCSLHYHYGWDSDKVVANAIFADGAASVVCDASRDGDTSLWQLAGCGSYLIPDASDEMTWTIGDHGFEMTLSARVPNLIRQYLRPWLSEWLKQYGLTIEQIGSWAIHPGGPRILQGVLTALDIPRSAARASFDVLADHGNMSSATIMFVIERLQQTDAELPCLAIGFGPGLVAEVALFV